MRAYSLACAAVALVALTACAVAGGKMDWVLVGGSRADGNITLGIDVPPVMGVSETKISWDINQANSEADRRCKNWGYANADMYREGQFPVLLVCHPQGMSPCWSKSYRIQYQCIDKAQN
jgi:hypothetical protein